MPEAGTCKVCGCTNDDCRRCIERTGAPCSWVTPDTPDLCSACAPLLDHCLVQIGRLSNQDFFKSDEGVLDDLSLALAQHSDNNEHATAIINAWKGSTRKMLHESDIPALADKTANRGKLPAACGACKKSDYVVVVVRGVEGVERCHCRRGVELRKLDEVRKARQRAAVDEALRDQFGEGAWTRADDTRMSALSDYFGALPEDQA